MDTIGSQITSLRIVYSTVYSGTDQRKHQSSVSLAFVRGIHRGPVNSLHKWPVTWQMFPFDHVIMRVSMVYFSNPIHQHYGWHWFAKPALSLLHKYLSVVKVSPCDVITHPCLNFNYTLWLNTSHIFTFLCFNKKTVVYESLEICKFWRSL